VEVCSKSTLLIIYVSIFGEVINNEKDTFSSLLRAIRKMLTL
jgi:hypothetical protein